MSRDTPTHWIEDATRLLIAGRHAEAEALYLRSLSVDRNLYPALNGMGLIRLKQGRPADAISFIERALALKPDNDGTWLNLGLGLAALGRHEEALASFDRIGKRQPATFAVRYFRALSLKALGRTEQALDEIERVLQEKPDHVDACVVRASLFWSRGDVEHALESYNRALALRPDMPEALWSRANCLWTRRQDVLGAIADLECLVSNHPAFPYAQGALLHMRMHAGDWRDLNAGRAALDEGVRAGRRVVEPFAYLGLATSPADLLSCAKTCTQDRHPPLARPPRKGRREGKIRVGYLCGEFRAQATMYLAAGLFEHHDRSRFEVTAFDNTPEDASALRSRVLSAFDDVVAIRDLPDPAAANLVESRDIDILINLNGYFGLQRMGVFAHRPARLQVNYLGYPGSLGAQYMDYILVDAEVVPDGHESFYAEKVVRLPGSYQVNDDKRPRPTPDSRASHGLQEADFVFCHFNNSYKITPEMFGVWMRLLGSVPASVLWMLESNARFAGSLRQQAVQAGVDPARLVFAPPMEHSAHISRLALGDLFLDSLPCNAHTTASDALWAGLPLLTCRGAAFPGRVAASLLRAVGLPDLIMNTLDEYEAKALSLARDRALLRTYRDHLTREPARLALFDTAQKTRQIEAAYEEMMARSARRESPADFTVSG